MCEKLSPTLKNTTFSSITPQPLDRFFSSSNLASLFRLPFRKKKVFEDRFRFTRVIVFTDRQTDRQTDGRTFFFCGFGISRHRQTTLSMETYVVLQCYKRRSKRISPDTSYGSKNESCISVEFLYLPAFSNIELN